MSELPATPFPPPPMTGNAAVDDALAGLEGLDLVDVAEHHARLGAVQDLLGGVLESSRGGLASIPQALRPGGVHG